MVFTTNYLFSDLKNSKFRSQKCSLVDYPDTGFTPHDSVILVDNVSLSFLSIRCQTIKYLKLP